MLAKSKLKYIQTLGQKKFRQEEGCFIAEGPKIVGELLRDAPKHIKEVFAVREWIDSNSAIAERMDVIGVSDKELERISQLSTPNQVLALVRQFDHGRFAANGKITLVLDTIQDPGNLGTIIRIADWFGIPQVVCSPDSADIYNSKVVQSSMGSIARVKILYMELKEWLSAQKQIPVYATVLDGQDIRSMKKLDEGIILVGNESKGLSPELLQLANIRITIPGKGTADSLNAAVATGIVLSHLL
jgi:RNA methyltransferase, TrmH family